MQRSLVLLVTLLLLSSMMLSGVMPVNANGPTGDIPAGLPGYFWFGVADNLGGSWMPNSGVPWNGRYQYLSGGVNTGFNGMSAWATEWQEQPDPPRVQYGLFATRYLNESGQRGHLPVFTYYQLLQSNPQTGADEADQNWANLNNTSTMYAYYADFTLLMQKAGSYGQKVIVHVEPDLWAYLQQRAGSSMNAASLSAAVSNSGISDISAYPNSVAGFAQALVHLRDMYAPNVLLAYHASPWGAGNDISRNTDPNLDVNGHADRTAAWFNSLGSGWSLAFVDVADRDAGYRATVLNDPGTWWDENNTTLPNFNRMAAWLGRLNQKINKRIVLWQVPIGNTKMRSVNNSPEHYQDNRVQYFLDAAYGYSHIEQYALAGVVGILFGRGDGNTTSNRDVAGSNGDGITNPEPINGNIGVASVADDDGGYLRERARAYYQAGRYVLPVTDLIAPTTPVLVQPANTDKNWTILRWSASTDTGSGIAGYSLQYQFQGETVWRTLVTNFVGTQYLFISPQAGSYLFRISANDRTGNVSPTNQTANYTSFGTSRAGLVQVNLPITMRSTGAGW